MAQTVPVKQLSSRQSGSRFLIIFLITSHNLCVKAKNMDVWLFILLAVMIVPTKLNGVAEQAQNGSYLIVRQTCALNNAPMFWISSTNSSVLIANDHWMCSSETLWEYHRARLQLSFWNLLASVNRRLMHCCKSKITRPLPIIC